MKLTATEIQALRAAAEGKRLGTLTVKLGGKRVLCPINVLRSLAEKGLTDKNGITEFGHATLREVKS